MGPKLVTTGEEWMEGREEADDDIKGNERAKASLPPSASPHSMAMATGKGDRARAHHQEGTEQNHSNETRFARVSSVLCNKPHHPIQLRKTCQSFIHKLRTTLGKFGEFWAHIAIIWPA